MNLKEKVNHPRKILIEGPTAVGKTELTLILAEHLSTEIISADSRAFYYEMKIGTARPEPVEGGIIHHLVAFLSLQEKLNVAEYLRRVSSIEVKLEQEKKPVLIAGGSPLYVRALLYGISRELPPTPPRVRAHYQKLEEKYGVKFLYKILEKIDFKRAQQLHPNDKARIMRALEIYRVSRKKMSDFIDNKYFKKERPTKYIKICLLRNREEIYRRINSRVDKMIQNGLVEEAENLFAKYGFENEVLASTIGYKEFIPYLQKKVNLKEVVEKIKTNTRRLAKRQLVWYKREKFFEINLTEIKNSKKVIEKMISFIKKNPIK